MKISPGVILGPKIRNLISIMRESVFIPQSSPLAHRMGTMREEITIKTADGEMVDFLITPLCRPEEALIVVTIPNHPYHPWFSPSAPLTPLSWH